MTAYRDILLGLIVMVLWAGNSVALKFITMEVEPFTGLAIRLVLASIVLAPFLRWAGWARFWGLLQVSFFMAVLHWGSLIWAVDKLDVSMAAILMQIQVIFAVLIGRFFFAERFGWRTGVGILIGVVGVVVLVGLPQVAPSMAGVLSMVFSMMMIAVAYARMKALGQIEPMNYIAHMHVLALVPGMILAFAFESPMNVEWGDLNFGVLGAALLYQIVAVSFAHVLWQRLMSRNAMSGLPNLTLLLPVLGVVMAMVFLGERVSIGMIAGGALTMAGVAIVMVRR